jgi:GT2 family glycosyltransferase
MASRAPGIGWAGMDDCLPLISVCIANYNGMEVIDDCLRSVVAQEGRLRVEILVHDDASSDASAAHIRHNYPQVRLIASDSNVGFCVANNRMAAEAGGKYLLLLNNDAALYPDALQTLLSEAARLDRHAILSLPQYDAASTALIDRGCVLDPFLNPIPNLNPARRDVAMVIGACLWIPRALWEELGGFPEWFGSIGEDLYLCCRARLSGYPVLALASSGYRHRVGMSFGGGKPVEGRLVTTFRRRALSERNKSFVMAMTYPVPLFHLIFPLHIALLLAEGLSLSLIRREWSLFRGVYLASIRSLWLERNRLLCFRKKIQAEKKIGLKAFWSVFQFIPHKLRMLFAHGIPEIR